jgi:hypothetical protein
MCRGGQIPHGGGYITVAALCNNASLGVIRYLSEKAAVLRNVSVAALS